MTEIIKEAQIVSGPFAAWVLTTSRGKGSWRFIKDVAPVFSRFKGQRFSKLVGWLCSKFGHCEITPIVRTPPPGYGSRQGRLFC